MTTGGISPKGFKKGPETGIGFGARKVCKKGVRIMQKIPSMAGKKSDLIHYAIRDKTTGKYFRYPKDCVNGERWEWVRGLNKASVNVERSTTEYVVCKFGIANCEIVEFDEYESYKKGMLHFRVLKE